MWKQAFAYVDGLSQLPFTVTSKYEVGINVELGSPLAGIPIEVRAEQVYFLAFTEVIANPLN